ncbi:MAG TPA: biotin/lipoyl-binding protein [Bacteroidales bacterium]|jgi:biotin carboxyl carrier protein|nr:biotin/lipoyl-binding protein [Bacteroidales bacterium]MDI9574684.1 biotin/lipoyl-binding protein [Bacteroidota bacterium]OQC60831.1 MAG: 2-oxoglutarate carboxylase large subunit [Bacteroidetes bacterium ADurb.Bin012]MBP9511146.1 biotin/lipoyl-binding protein [Bacteroidales bacterium]MBP9588356.1 biotin/lipoyl-binding protein [Bacteroidales bacterium]
MNEENLPIPSEELPPIEMVKVNVDGSTFLTTLSPKFKLSKPYKINEPDKITAFIPGIIINVLVKKNQVVRKGDKLLILMAMKMNNHIRAPFDAIVKKIYVKKGDQVKKDQLLVELQPILELNSIN